jgi:hypothetical protein
MGRASGEVAMSPRRKRKVGFAHLEICIAPDGSFKTYPTGNPEPIVQALRVLVRVLTEHPETALCIAGACDHAHASETLQ